MEDSSKLSFDVELKLYNDVEGCCISLSDDLDGIGMLEIKTESKAEEYWGKCNLLLDEITAKALANAILKFYYFKDQLTKNNSV